MMSRTRFRLSLRSLLIVVALFSVAFAALARPNEIVAIAIFNCTLVVIGVGIIEIFLARGDLRAFWFAFTLFSGGHLMLALGPGFGGSTSQVLVSSRALRAMRPELYPLTPSIEWYTLAGPAPTFGNQKIAASYVLTGHSFLSLFAGLVAGSFTWVIAQNFKDLHCLSSTSKLEMSPRKESTEAKSDDRPEY
jgi:hypothetical protein